MYTGPLNATPFCRKYFFPAIVVHSFYNNKNGTVVTGWNKIGGKRYYFNDYGMMLINTTVDGYNIDNDGVAHKAK